VATWLIGDIHGCAAELADLCDRLELTEDDRVLSVGDLFHRGPDPAGVMDVLREVGADFILGNHELRVLERFQLDPAASDGSDRPALRTDFPPLGDDDLAGDGRRACIVAPERRAEVLAFLQGHVGYFAESTDYAGAGPTRDGRPWCAVHAGLPPGRAPGQARPTELACLRRLPQRGNPFWYEVYAGTNLIVFGHTPSKIPRARRVNGRLVTLGIDTGCVYGGSLTAYAPELDELRQVKARKAYAAL